MKNRAIELNSKVAADETDSDLVKQIIRLINEDPDNPALQKIRELVQAQKKLS